MHPSVPLDSHAKHLVLPPCIAASIQCLAGVAPAKVNNPSLQYSSFCYSGLPPEAKSIIEIAPAEWPICRLGAGQVGIN